MQAKGLPGSVGMRSRSKLPSYKGGRHWLGFRRRPALPGDAGQRPAGFGGDAVVQQAALLQRRETLARFS